MIRQAVRLQIEHELQAVLDLTQEPVSIIEYPILGVGQAADALQGGQGLESVALAGIGQIAAVEKLQELDGEFDVADAAVPRLDLRVALAVPPRALLHAPPAGLDLL